MIRLYISLIILCFTLIRPVFGQSDTTVETFIYKQIDTTSLSLSVFYPNGFDQAKVYPTIIFFFGGGWSGGNAKQFEPQAKYFSGRNMIAILVDYRVRKRHHTTPFEALNDAKSAIRYVRKNAEKLNVDTNRIVASGGSAGGQLAAACANITGLEEEGEDLSISSRPNALILFNPAIDNGPGGYGYDRLGERYHEFSPLHNIHKNAPPTVIFLGTKDQYIPVETVKYYKIVMENVGSRCDLHLYEGQKHGFFNFNRGNEYYKETLREADKFLVSLGYLEVPKNGN